MRSAIAILTYRRVEALKVMLDGINKHCPQYRCAVFEDLGQRDATEAYLKQGRTSEPAPGYLATEWVAGDRSPNPGVEVFLGERNLGVAGNSNRALKWFMNSGLDHLVLCNDDLHIDGNFVDFYGKAHEDLGLGMFCFCDFTHHDSYKWITYPWRGYTLKMLPRMTGIMMSITRKVVDDIGYFDTEFGQFGEEHCDYTIRARMAGHLRIDRQDMNCLDIEHKLLRHQNVKTSVTGSDRLAADRRASLVMQRAAEEYKFRHYYRPFRLVYPDYSGGFGGNGISTRNLEQLGYTVVTDLV